VPTLKTFTSRFQGLPISGGRVATAGDFGAEQAQATGELARTAAKVGDAHLQNVEEAEARRALVGTTEIRAKYARELDQAAQTGANTEDLKIKMDADLSKVGEEFQTSKGKASLDMYAANTYLMFDEQANRIEVQRAAATARLEGQKYIVSSSALIQGNPLYLPEAERGVDDLISTFTRIGPEKRAEMALELKQNLNMSAALAYARIDPETTKRKLEAGEWNLTSEQRNVALNRATTEISARRAEESYARARQKEELIERDDVARDKHFKDVYAGRGSRRAILDDADLRPQTREHLLMVMDRHEEHTLTAEKKSDPVAIRNAWTKITNGEWMTSEKVVELVAQGKLNARDGEWLTTIVRQQKDENGRSINASLYAMASSFQRSLEQDPHMAAAKFTGQIPAIVNEYTAMAQEQINAARQANDPGALRELFDPKSKKFLGSPDFMQSAVTRVKTRKQEELRSKIPTALTREEYDALPAGALYIGPDGNQATKGGPSGVHKGVIRSGD